MRKLLIICFLAIMPILGGCSMTANAKAGSVSVNSSMLYDSIVIEVLPSEEHIPSRAFMHTFKKNLQKYRICESKNIHFVVRPILKEIPMAWDFAKIHRYGDENRILVDNTTTNRNLILFIINLPGNCVEPEYESIIGLQYDTNSFAYFYEGPRTMSLWLHEFGHVIGLVNPKKRWAKPINPKRPRHCNSKKCYMFWRSNNAKTFCERCLKDIRKIIRIRRIF